MFFLITHITLKITFQEHLTAFEHNQEETFKQQTKIKLPKGIYRDKCNLVMRKQTLKACCMLAATRMHYRN